MVENAILTKHSIATMYQHYIISRKNNIKNIVISMYAVFDICMTVIIRVDGTYNFLNDIGCHNTPRRRQNCTWRDIF